MSKHFSTSTKAAYLDQFHQSGLTQSAFCREHGLVLKTFNNWLSRSKSSTVSSFPFNSSVDTDQKRQPFHHEDAIPKHPIFIPIYLNDTDVDEPSLHHPREPDCSVSLSKNVSQARTLCFKTDRFSFDISLDLSTDDDRSVLTFVTQTLHQLSDGQDSYD